MEQTEAFRVLASADRQLVLHELLERDGVATIAELARQVAVRRHRIAPEKIRDEQISRARARLVHAHFPRLLENNIIEVDWATQEVRLVDETCVDRLFEAAEELDSWPPTDLLERLSS